MWNLLSGIIYQNIQTERKLEIKIRVTNDENKELCPPFKRILPNKNLREIRNLLRNINNQRDFRMRTDLIFFVNNRKILHNEEASLNLKEIITDGNVLNIRQPGVDWQKLIDKCDHGFIIENGKVKKAKHRTFIINKNNIGLEARKTLNGGMEIGQEICKNKLEGLCKRNFIAGGQFSTISPWLTLFLGVSKQDSSEFLRDIPIEKYSYTVVKKAELSIPESSITLTEEFKNEVENALAKKTISEKIDGLRQVSKKYGHFYARHIVFGGAIIEKLTNTETSIYEEESFIRIIGGDRKYHGNIKINKKPWFDSLEDFQTWEIIEYDKICPIFDLLDDKLRKEVLITLGQRILAADIVKKQCEPNQTRFQLNEIFEALKKSKKIISVDDCQIFASIMNKDTENIFSIHVEYLDKNSPEIVVHSIAKNEYQNQSISIGWIIVGYPENFDFDNTEVILKSDKYSVTENLGCENIFVAKNLGYESEKHSCILGTCVIETPEKAQYDPYKSTLIIGSHFDLNKNSACIFIRNNENNVNISRLKLFSR
ncbi:26656_t:CDS:2 [Gigaspora margarita]|uniref:26656_t:CDS:1 n=1 Tax=Gigaspora margarita TaxID=4874 RepID=A0ABN7UWC0_GIGMA|nr:26656_t:CDS:2 [Gigaspora margarita]